MKLVINPPPSDVQDWEQQWKDWLRNERRLRGETEHWDWFGKMLRVGPEMSAVLLALVDDDGARCHGLMMIKWPHDSRLAPGRPCAYVDYREIAPWHRTNCTVAREYEGIGKLFMAQAVIASEDLMFEGRVGLCSLPQSEGFYRSIGLVEQGMGDRHDHELPYFEFPAAVAATFVNEVMAKGVQS